jgi:hypothetical protein
MSLYVLTCFNSRVFGFKKSKVFYSEIMTDSNKGFGVKSTSKCGKKDCYLENCREEFVKIQKTF